MKNFKKFLKKGIDFYIVQYYTMCNTTKYAGGQRMDVQIKKGVLDLCVLNILSKSDSYGYDISDRISRCIDVGDGTVYPILRKLNANGYLTTYLKESNDGPPRKYYKITQEGRDRYKLLLKEWYEFNESVVKLLEGKTDE